MMTAKSRFTLPLSAAVRCALAAAALLAPAAARGDETGIDMSLTPAADQAAAAGPYRAADMRLVNHGSDALREVSLRWTEGGPTFVWPVALGPGAELTKRVFLLAGAPLQTYRATFKGAPPPPPGRATISWPIDTVARDALVSPSAYASHEREGPTWSAQMRLNVMLGAAIAALAAATTLFLPPRVLRTGVLLGVISLAAAAAAVALGGTEVVVEDVVAFDAGQTPGQADGERCLHVVAVRRTTRWSHPDARLEPIYKDTSQMDGETMTIDPRHGASVVISPGELRLFRATARGL